MILQRVLLYMFVAMSGLRMARPADLRNGALYNDPLVIMTILMTTWMMLYDVWTLYSVHRSRQERLIRKLVDLTADPTSNEDLP